MSGLLGDPERRSDLGPRQAEAAPVAHLVPDQLFSGDLDAAQGGELALDGCVHDVAVGVGEFSELLLDVHASSIPDDAPPRQDILTRLAREVWPQDIKHLRITKSTDSGAP